jgi:hypothetical protein
MTSATYSMSFTTGTLLYQESLVVARLFAELGEWDAVRQQVLADNLLQMRTENASQRVYREVVSRLKQLTPAQFDLLLQGSRAEQNHLLWLAVCKRYRFIYDFAVEVLREKFLRLDLELAANEYDAFFFDKAEWHPEVEAVTETTRKKQRQFVLKMLREADLLSADGHILPGLLSPTLIAAVAADSPAHLAIYPVSEAELRLWLP